MHLWTTGKLGAILQLAVLLMVQFSAVAPGLARTRQHHVLAESCCGKHLKCGCSPERVASRSCCCYPSGRVQAALTLKPSSCENSASKGKQNKGELDRLLPALSSIPCGGDSAIATSSENVKFIGAYLLHVEPVTTVTGQFLLPCCVCLDRYLEPPDPPPKPAALS
jgi:hypothetical protein